MPWNQLGKQAFVLYLLHDKLKTGTSRKKSTWLNAILLGMRVLVGGVLLFLLASPFIS